MKLVIDKRRIVQSDIRTMSLECDKVRGINLAQGVCDLPTPKILKDAAKKAIDDGINQYTRYDGLIELREAVAKKLMRYNRIKADSEANVVISCGATGAFYCASLALLKPDDEMIVFEPYYGYHINTLLSVGVKPIFARLDNDGWTYDIEHLAKLVSKRTKGILINTPSNPSGKVFSRKELNELADFCIEHDLMVFSDEIYEYFVYDGSKHVSPGSLPKISDRTITVSGPSKTFSVTGWRIGYCACHEKYSQIVGYVNDLIYVCAPAPLQVGVCKGLNELPRNFYDSLARQYQHKRDKLCCSLDSVGLTPSIPKGAYYVLADASGLRGKNSREKAMYLLRKTGIAAVPGSAFYHDKAGENLLRFCFAKEDKVLDKACKMLLKIKRG